MRKPTAAAAAATAALVTLTLLPTSVLAQSDSSPSCAGDGERAQECGAANPTRPLSCCDGYQCADRNAGGSMRCVARKDRPTTADAISGTADAAQCGIDAVPSGAKCEDGMCCSAQGVCGYTAECAEGCQSGPCDDPPATDSSVPTKYKPPSDTKVKTVDVADLSPLDAETYSLLTGCGQYEDDKVSRQYAAVMLDMHKGMAIKFTGNDEFDFLAGMIPHHAAAVDMCSVYYHAAKDGGTLNKGIESLCYNITYGPVDGLGYGAQYQSDFSQVGETEQMMDVITQMDKVSHFEKGCNALSDDEKRQLVVDIHDAIRPNNADDNVGMLSGHPAAGATSPWDDMDLKEMFMGCGKLELPSTREYLSSGMKMHLRMALEWTGDNDVDFLLGMVAHHEGAIEMCNTYYRYWSCAPVREVCSDPLPLDEVQKLMSNHEQVSTLNAMHHICAGHILAAQPKELQWMRRELHKLDPIALDKYEAQLGPDGQLLIDQLPCAYKYLAVPYEAQVPGADDGDAGDQCAVQGQKARSCGASSHQYKQDCCVGLFCSSDKHCVSPKTAADTDDDVELVPGVSEDDIGTAFNNDYSSNSKQSKSTGASSGGLSGVAVFFIVVITLGAVLMVANVVIRRRGGSIKGEPYNIDTSINLSPHKTTDDDGELQLQEVYMI